MRVHEHKHWPHFKIYFPHADYIFTNHERSEIQRKKRANFVVWIGFVNEKPQFSQCLSEYLHNQHCYLLYAHIKFSKKVIFFLFILNGSFHSLYLKEFGFCIFRIMWISSFFSLFWSRFFVMTRIFERFYCIFDRLLYNRTVDCHNEKR